MGSKRVVGAAQNHGIHPFFDLQVLILTIKSACRAQDTCASSYDFSSVYGLGGLLNRLCQAIARQQNKIGLALPSALIFLLIRYAAIFKQRSTTCVSSR